MFVGSVDMALARLRKRGWVRLEPVVITRDARQRPGSPTLHMYRLTNEGFKAAQRAYLQHRALWKGMPTWPDLPDATSTMDGN